MLVTGGDQSHTRATKKEEENWRRDGPLYIASLVMPWTDNPYENECLHGRPVLIIQNDDPSYVETVKGLRSALFLFNHIRMNERAYPT